MAVELPTALLLLQFWDAGTIWILIPLAALAIPIVAILTGPIMLRMKQAERREARKLYERIAMEKLDVVKTAVAMGFEQSELKDLDRRLEQLVGAEKLERLVSGKDAPAVPQVKPDSDMLDADLAAEIDRLQRQREKE